MGKRSTKTRSLTAVHNFFAYKGSETCEKTLKQLKKGRNDNNKPARNVGIMDEYIEEEKSNGNTKLRVKDDEEKEFTEKQANINNNGNQLVWLDRNITPEEERHIRQALLNHFLFSDLTEEVMQLVLCDLIQFQLEKGKLLYEEGFAGNYFFIVAKGKLQATVNGVYRRTFQEWDCFGELSLIGKCTREETVTCVTDVLVFILDGESFRDIQGRMNEIRLRERFTFLNSISIFKSLDNISKHNIVEKIKVVEFQQFEKIISMGDIGDTLYLIKEGLVSCKNKFQEIRKLGNNEYFGQNSILIDTRRTLDVIAIQRTVCFELSRADLQDALGENFRDVILFSLFQDFISQHNYFKDIFIESHILPVFKCFYLKTYSLQEKIFNSKSKNNKKIITVIEGNLVDEKKLDIIAGRGGIIGEDVLKKFHDVPKDVMAYPDCIALEAELESLSKILKLDLNLNPLNLFNQINKLKKISLFKNLSEKTLESIANSMKKQKFTCGECIVEENTFGDQFYLITKGRVRVSQNGRIIRELENGSSFGEIAVINPEEKRTASVHAIENTICYILSKEDFDVIIGEKTIKEYLLKKLPLQDTSITLKDLYFIKFLGKGKFGSVNLVHNKKNVYAIKSVSRKNASRQKMLGRYFVSERRVMLSLDHPFIVKMVKSLKNECFCFFLLEYVNGKNLDDYLSSRKLIKNVDETRFYIASILVMIEYLHKKLIIHRDIKPSNIMIDSNGYLKLIDFGTAKVITDYTSTIIGTPHYIAPEILQGKGYSSSCDFWSVGICIYEIFYGICPFGKHATDVIEVYKEILHKDLTFPGENSKTTVVNAFIRELLNKKINMRVCNIPILKSRPFFEGFNWDDLIEFKLEAPYKPNQWDWTKHYDCKTPFELSLENEISDHKYKDSSSESSPLELDTRWADEF